MRAVSSPGRLRFYRPSAADRGQQWEERKACRWRPGPVADFYREVMDRLKALGLEVRICTMPVEIPDPVPFERDREHATYDPPLRSSILARAGRSWIASYYSARGFRKGEPRAFLLGASIWRSRVFPVVLHRSSGRADLADAITREAYSHEVSSCGFWPGKDSASLPSIRTPPEPAGYADAHVLPDGASYNQELHEFILPYDVARRSAAPDQIVLQFLESTYAPPRILGIGTAPPSRLSRRGFRP